MQSTEFGIMQKITNYISKININTIIIFSLFLIFIFISSYIYYKYILKKLNSKFNHNLENSNNNSGDLQAELLLFSVDWCPHCKKAKPIWDDLKSEYENKNINGYKIIFTDIDCTNETPEIESIIKKYSIDGYPTIKLLKDNQVIEYDAKPSKSTLSEFLNTVL
jgi:thiol-disulfide isomerase/thioredoxin